MKIMIKARKLLVFTAMLVCLPLQAQNNEDVKWKTIEQVKAIYGEPESIVGPVGTFANYQLWKYNGFSIAIANNRVFHKFDKDSLTKFELNEER